MHPFVPSLSGQTIVLIEPGNGLQESGWNIPSCPPPLRLRAPGDYIIDDAERIHVIKHSISPAAEHILVKLSAAERVLVKVSAAERVLVKLSAAERVLVKISAAERVLVKRMTAMPS